MKHADKKTFVYEPKAPKLSHSHPEQRRFLYPHLSGGVNLFRFEDQEAVVVGLEVYAGGGSCGVQVRMDAVQLTLFAMALLDAAHDLQTVPAVF